MSKISDETREKGRIRQRKRRKPIDDIAKKLGYSSWQSLGTAVKNGEVSQVSIVIAKTQIIRTFRGNQGESK